MSAVCISFKGCLRLTKGLYYFCMAVLFVSFLYHLFRTPVPTSMAFIHSSCVWKMMETPMVYSYWTAMQWVGPWSGNVTYYLGLGMWLHFPGLGMWPTILVWECDLYLGLGMWLHFPGLGMWTVLTACFHYVSKWCQYTFYHYKHLHCNHLSFNPSQL